MSEPLQVSVDDGVGWLVLNRPRRANALSRDLMTELITAVEDFANDDRVRVVVLTGSGGVFCAGRDLAEAASAPVSERGRSPMAGLYRNVCEVVHELPKPTVCAVNGPAVAAGFELVLACDVVLASEQAFFQVPEAQRGLAANFASVVLAQALPRAVAFELLYTGRRMPASEARRWGLVNDVTEADDLAERAQRMARSIGQGAPLSLRRIKSTMVRAVGMPTAAALRLDTGPSPYESEDRIEGAQAFLEKRAPIWRNR